jgi:CheY-like chemotaxis protein
MGTILIVEDDDMLRSCIREILEDEGYETADAPDGRQALQLATSLDLDLVISDIEMPELSGGELLIVLQNLPSVRGTPVIAITGLSDLRRASDTGFAAILRKPFDLEEMLEVVRQALSLGSSLPQASTR